MPVLWQWHVSDLGSGASDSDAEASGCESGANSDSQQAAARRGAPLPAWRDSEADEESDVEPPTARRKLLPWREPSTTASSGSDSDSPSSYDSDSSVTEGHAKSVADASLSPERLALLLDGSKAKEGQAFEVDKTHVRQILKQGAGCRCKWDCCRSSLAA